MSVIQKIRTKYAKLAGFVIAAALVAFILMDAFSSRSVSSLFGNDGSIAKVDGEKIDNVSYLNRVEQYNVLYSYTQPDKELDDETRMQLNQQALNDLVNEILITKECEKLGLTTTKKEGNDLIYGPNPHQGVQNFQYFRDPQTGRFNPQNVKAFETQIKANLSDPNAKLAYDQWNVLQAFILRNNVINKYNALLTNNIYIPTFLVEKQVKENQQSASIDFVTIPLSADDDKDVKITEAEMLSYMKKHKALYTIKDASRSIEYISFDIAPKSRDTARALAPLNNLKPDFATVDTANVKAFVNRNSDQQYGATYVMKKTFRSAFSDSIFNLQNGAVFGPYFENNSYKITKLLDRKRFPDSVKCRHILITTTDGANQVLPDSIAKARIDSIVLAIRSGANFDTMVNKFSDDVNSKPNGGEYTFLFDQRLGISQEFQDFVFEDGRKGQSKVVKVTNPKYSGYHYIEILDQTGFATAAKTATIIKQLFPNDETETEIYNAASEFAINNNTATKFDEAMKKNQASKRVAASVKKSDFNIPGLGASRELIRWMYDAKVGDVSTVISLKGKYIVAKVTDIQNKGLANITDNNRQSLEGLVRNEKIVKKVADQYKDASSLAQIAQTAKVEVKSADSFKANSSFIPSLGYEPKVAGYSFYQGFAKSKVSPAINGQAGVFFITVKDRFTSKQPTDPNLIAQQKSMMEAQIKNSVGASIIDILKKDVEIIYNVDNF